MLRNQERNSPALSLERFSPSIVCRDEIRTPWETNQDLSNEKIQKDLNSTQPSEIPCCRERCSVECESEELLQSIKDWGDSVLFHVGTEKELDDASIRMVSDDFEPPSVFMEGEQKSKVCADGLDMSELDAPITCSGDQLPVAAELVKQLDLLSPTCSQEEESMVGEYQSESHGSGEDDGSCSQQDDQWAERFRELRQYKEQLGHCSVPHNYEENLPLARWVKRQRHRYKPFRDEGCPLVPNSVRERIDALDSLGFVWDCQEAAWDDKFLELLDYRANKLDCNVPINYTPNPALAIWVKGQRRQYKLYLEGRKTGMNEERIRKLESVGFKWEIRKNKKARRF